MRSVRKPRCGLARLLNDPGQGDDDQLITILNNAKIVERAIDLTLDGDALAKLCSTKRAEIDDQLLSVSVFFIQKPRGIETRFVMADASAKPDPTLIANIARASLVE